MKELTGITSNSDNTITELKENKYAPNNAITTPITKICLFIFTSSQL